MEQPCKSGRVRQMWALNSLSQAVQGQTTSIPSAADEKAAAERWEKDIAMLDHCLYQVFTNDFDGAEASFKKVDYFCSSAICSSTWFLMSSFVGCRNGGTAKKYVLL